MKYKDLTVSQQIEVDNFKYQEFLDYDRTEYHLSGQNIFVYEDDIKILDLGVDGGDVILWIN